MLSLIVWLQAAPSGPGLRWDAPFMQDVMKWLSWAMTFVVVFLVFRVIMGAAMMGSSQRAGSPGGVAAGRQQVVSAGIAAIIAAVAWRFIMSMFGMGDQVIIL